MKLPLERNLVNKLHNVQLTKSSVDLGKPNPNKNQENTAGESTGLATKQILESKHLTKFVQCRRQRAKKHRELFDPIIPHAVSCLVVSSVAM